MCDMHISHFYKMKLLGLGTKTTWLRLGKDIRDVCLVLK